MVPLRSFLPAAFKLIVASFRHPNSDKEVVVHDDNRVEVHNLTTREDRHTTANA